MKRKKEPVSFPLQYKVIMLRDAYKLHIHIKYILPIDSKKNKKNITLEDEDFLWCRFFFFISFFILLSFPFVFI